jgi:Spy/CpxP family protein refolding chaperone
MKTMFKMSAIGMLTLILSAGNLLAQNQSSAPAKGNGRGAASILSDNQKQMLKEISAKKQAFRKEFKASFSQKQKDILSNPRVMPAERQKEFRASLTDEQVNMIKANREDMQKMREDFRASLTPDQKATMKKMNMNRRMRTGTGPRAGMGNPMFMN